MEKSAILESVEKSFSELKQNPKDEASVKRIARLLGNKFDLNLQISVVPNKSNEFFGMSVYPEISMIDELVNEMIKDGTHRDRESRLAKMWGAQKNWIIEIDEMILTDYNLNANPAELTAVILHEIGHVIYNNTVPNRALKVFRYQITRFNYKTKKILKWKRAQKILDLAIIEACSAKSFSKYSKHELSADKFAFSQGYGDELHAFIDKLLKAYGNSMIDRTEDEIEDDITQVMIWSLETIRELEFRKNSLERMLETVGLRTSSVLTKTLLVDIRNAFFSKESDKKFVGMLKESVMSEYKNYAIVTEHDCMDKHDLPKRVKDVDINMIEIAYQKIDTLDDKLYVLDLIHALQNTLEEQQYLLTNKQSNVPTMTQESINKFNKQLEVLRQETVKKKTRRIKTFFKTYPTGYEG